MSIFIYSIRKLHTSFSLKKLQNVLPKSQLNMVSQPFEGGAIMYFLGNTFLYLLFVNTYLAVIKFVDINHISVKFVTAVC